MKNAIDIKGVSKTYRDFTLDSLTLSLPEGSIMGLIGENGAGKSTTIKLIMNAILPDSGSIEVLGMDNKSPEFAEAKEDIGVVLDEAYFPINLNCKNVNTIMRLTYRKWDSDKYFGYIKEFGLPEKKAFKDFSRGMKMKLAIAVALSHDPKLLVLDEATAGLDPIVRDEVVELFREFTREEDHSVLISSHILSDLEKLCDYIAFLHNGQLLFCAEKDAMLEELGLFTGTAEQADSLLPDAVVGREASGYGGVRALVKRDLVPPTLELERPTVEDVILFMVKGAKQA